MTMLSKALLLEALSTTSVAVQEICSGYCGVPSVCQVGDDYEAVYHSNRLCYHGCSAFGWCVVDAQDWFYRCCGCAPPSTNFSAYDPVNYHGECYSDKASLGDTASSMSKVAVAPSLGDRYVLQIHYNDGSGGQYQDLPLTVKDAQAVGWEVSEDCVPGLGRRAQADHFLDLWNDGQGALHLWYDLSGSVMGFGVRAKSGVGGSSWRKVGDHFEIDFLTRDPAAACGKGPAPEDGSIGDRLLLVGSEGNVPIPTTRQGAVDEKYNDGGPCFPRMGWHMMLDRYEASSPTPVYNGGDGSLIAMNVNSYEKQETPAFEYPAPKEGKAVYGLHVYFKEHDNACEGSPETAYASPFVAAPDSAAYTDFHCTPYFGNLWVQTLTTVVDLQATGSACQEAGLDECKYVHYAGPRSDLGFATPCVPPAPEEGCHCYHQVTYDEGCLKQIQASNASGTWDTLDAFDEDGVLRDCSGAVVSNVVVGWAPPVENPTPCECEGTAMVQV